MKRLLALILFCAAPALADPPKPLAPNVEWALRGAFAQILPAGNTNTISFAGAPSGNCAFNYFAVRADTGALYDCLSGSWNLISSGGGSGTVTSFSAGALSPLFTTSVATATSTPALSFSLSNAAANSVFGNFTGSSAAPGFSAAPVFSAANLTNFPASATTYPGAGVPNSTGSAWGTSYTAPTGNLVGTGQANTYTTGLQNFNAGTMQVPSSAAYAPTTASLFGYDSTNNRYVGGNGTNTSYFTWVTAAPTSNVIPKFSGTLGLVTGSTLSDNGTTVSTTEPISVGASVTTTADGTHPSSISLVGNTTLPSPTANTVTILGFPAATNTAWSLQVPTAIPTNLHMFYCAVTSTNCLLTDTGYAYNAIPAADIASGQLGSGVQNSSSLNLTGTVASGTAAMGTSLIASGACATVVTVSASGVATTDTIIATPNADPTGVTGYAVSATGSLYIQAYPTSGNVNFKVCNNTSGSLTPSALTLNWRVVR